MNIVVWGGNCIFQVLPFIGNDSYGLSVSFLGRGFCSLGTLFNSNDHPLKQGSNGDWLSAVFFYPLCIMGVIMILLDIYLYFYLLPAYQSEKISKLVLNIVAYPVGMFILWMPTYLVLGTYIMSSLYTCFAVGV